MLKKKAAVLVRKLYERNGSVPDDGYELEWAAAFSACLERAGYSAEWWQEGETWTRELLPGVTVHSVTDGTPSMGTLPGLNQAFWENCGSYTLGIYADPLLAYPQVTDGSIVLLGDIPTPAGFMGPAADSLTREQQEEFYRRVFMGLACPGLVVASGLHYIQWAISTWHGLSHKFSYIPDCPAPLPAAPGGAGGDRLRALFSAPLLPRHGVSDAMRAADVVTARRQDTEFVFTGWAPPSIRPHLQRWLATRERVYWRPPAPGDFDGGPLVLCLAGTGPPRAREALAAMGRGGILVASPRGSLADFIIDGHNGLVVNPAAGELAPAIERVAARPSWRRSLSHNARLTAASYSQQRWEENWARVLEQARMTSGG
ncbi:MAG: hypothetical protein AB1445_12475 [Bacillota bacterium]